MQFALFAMLVQAMIPFSSALALPGADAQARQGQDIPGFYLVICTAYGAQSSAIDGDQPLDGGSSAVMPWDCPACQVQAHQVFGPLPSTPQVASIPYPLPLGDALPRASERVVELWTAAPRLARAPPRA